LNRLYKHIVNLLVLIPFPNALFGLENNVPTLAHLSFLTLFMVLLTGMRLSSIKVKTGLFVIYLLTFGILVLNMNTLFTFTFSVRILFAITAGWFLYVWNLNTGESELTNLLKKILYVVGITSIIIHVMNPPPDGRLVSLFDVHTGKYFFFAIIIILTHQVLRYNRRSDYIALSFGFLMLSLSMQRGILATTIVFFVLTFREKLFKKLTWIALVIVIAYQLGVFDPLINRLFYAIPASGSLRDMVANINSSGRLEFWSYLWENEEITFFGKGLGYSIELGKKQFPGLNLVHNDFLWILIDAGIAGLSIFLYILYYVYKRASRLESWTLQRVYVSLILSILFVMAVDNVLLHIYIYFPLLFAYFTLQSKRLST
jgi:hypothetical protein